MPSLADEHLLRRGEALARMLDRWAERLQAQQRALWATLCVGQRFQDHGGYTVTGITQQGATVRFDDGTEQCIINPYPKETS